MTAPLGRAAPLRFHIGLLLCWTMGRVVMLTDWSGGTMASAPAGHVDRRVEGHRAPRQIAYPAARHLSLAGTHVPPPRLRGRWRAEGAAEGRLVARLAYAPPPPAAPAVPLPRNSGGGFSGDLAPRTAVDAPAILAAPRRARRHWSGSAWAFVRGGGRTQALAPVGQIGGGQAGARLLYRLDGRGTLAAAARLSRTIGGPRQTEAAIGLDWRPVARLPLHIMADRRIAIDRGGRTAWTLGAAGGVYALALTPRWRLDGYGEAGVVGTRRRDLYADGAVRVGRAIDLGGGASLAPGGGLWGAAQPGARRLDLGPSAVLRLPVDGHAVSIALDWRERVAGGARPGSGLALTVAMDL